MTVATFIQPDRTTQSGAQYPANIDAATAVVAQTAGQFAPHEQGVPNMTVRLDPGRVYGDRTVVVIPAQDTGTITAPVGNPRVDRVVVDKATGLVSVLTGTPGPSPGPPLIPSDKTSICQIALATSTIAITNSLITDERVPDVSAVRYVDAPGWQAIAEVVQIGANVWVAANVGVDLPNFVTAMNLYYDGVDWRYASNGFGSVVVQSSDGTLATFTAPSGITGTVASITLRSRVTNDGVPVADTDLAPKSYVDASEVSTGVATVDLSAVQGGSHTVNLGSPFSVEVGNIIEVSLNTTSGISGIAGQLYTLAWSATGVTLDASGGSRGNMCVFGNGGIPAMPSSRLRVTVGGTCQLVVILRNVATTAGAITITNPSFNFRMFSR